MVKARMGSGWPAVVRPRLALVASVGWHETTLAWPDPGPPWPDLASAMPVPSPGVVAAVAQALPAGGLRRERFWAMSTAVVKVSGSTCAVVSIGLGDGGHGGDVGVADLQAAAAQ